MISDSSLIVQRDKEGRLRAFYHVCRHRGGRFSVDAEQAVHHFQERLPAAYRGLEPESALPAP